MGEVAGDMNAPPWPRWLAALGLGLVVAATLAGGLVRGLRWARSDAEGLRRVLPAAVRQPERYTGAAACRPCHPAAFESWHHSYHRSMTQAASPAAVLGRFDGAPLDEHGHAAWRRGDGFYVDMPGAEGQIEPRRVVMTTGSHHMQVYWVAEESGALVSFPYSFLLEENAWVPNESTLLRPGEVGVVYTWNRVCIQCHAVAGVPGFEPQTGTVRSSVVDLGIACEACHGPGRAHVDHFRSPLARYRERGGESDASVVGPSRASAAVVSEICAQCHSITAFHDDDAWVRQGHEVAPPASISRWGTVIQHPAHADQPQLDVLLEQDSEYLVSRFWSDGMVRVSGREYNGLIASPCRDDPAFGCLSCHSMHAPSDRDDQLRADRTGDAMCTQCHDDPARWGSAHTHHAPQSPGSRCANCHMPHTTYGLLKAMRSHQIDRPSVQATLDTGRPNACNACHLDRTLAWTADALHRWYGDPMPSEALPPDPAMIRWLIAGDAGQRALAAWHFGWEPALAASRDPFGTQDAADAGAWAIPWVAALLDDPYPAVQRVALRTLSRLSGGPPRSVSSFETHPMRPEDRARLATLRSQRDERAVDLAE